MAKHVKTVASWDLFHATVLGVDVAPSKGVQLSYGGKIRRGTVERIGQREDGSIVLNVETQDGFRNFDADLIESFETFDLVF